MSRGLTIDVGNDAGHRGLGSIALTIDELFLGKHDWLVINEAEWDSSVVGGSEFVLVASVH